MMNKRMAAVFFTANPFSIPAVIQRRRQHTGGLFSSHKSIYRAVVGNWVNTQFKFTYFQIIFAD